MPKSGISLSLNQFTASVSMFPCSQPSLLIVQRISLAPSSTKRRKTFSAPMDRPTFGYSCVTHVPSKSIATIRLFILFRETQPQNLQKLTPLIVRKGVVGFLQSAVNATRGGVFWIDEFADSFGDGFTHGLY